MRTPGWALAGSAALHLAVVMLLGMWSFSPTHEAGSAGDSRRTAVRWVSDVPEPATPTSSDLLAPGGVPSPASTEPPSLAESGRAGIRDEGPSPPRAPVAGVTDLAPADPVAGPPPVTAPVTATDAVDGYLPRKALSVAPAPLEQIALAWPAGMTVIGRQTAVFTVFIDETGVVRKMVPDGPTLQPTLEAAARDTFTAATFSPGQLDGRPVKAMIRIEVVFDASVPVASAPRAPTPAVVSSQNL